METIPKNSLEFLTSEEIEALVGKPIRVQLKKETIEGKFLQSTFPDMNGYKFIFRNGKTIMKIGSIFPGKTTPEYFPESAVRIARIEEGEYLLEAKGFGFAYYYKGEEEYEKLNNFLNQQVFEFEAVN